MMQVSCSRVVVLCRIFKCIVRGCRLSNLTHFLVGSKQTKLWRAPLNRPESLSLEVEKEAKRGDHR